MSLVSSMNIAQQALSINQAAITTVSNNIANVDTPAYSKLRANLTQVVNYSPYDSYAGNATSIAEACNGVTISSVTRYSDWYIQNYYWQENGTNSYFTQAASTASNVEDIVNELNDTGLSAALENFYTAANALHNDPSDITTRQNYVSAATNVCTVFNTTSANLTDIKKSLVGTGAPDGSLESSEIYSQVNDVNNLLSQLADLNANFIKTSNGTTPSTSLLDQRDSLLSELSSLIPFTVEENNNGTVNISLGNAELVKGGEVKGCLKVSNTGDADSPVTASIVYADDTTKTMVPDVTDDISSGSIGAILDVCGTDSDKFTIYNVLEGLNNMASEFSSVMNKIQTSTNYPSGTNTPMAIDRITKTLIVSTENLLTTSDGSATTTAANITVNSDIINDPYLVAAARVDTASVGDVDEVGNSSNMTLVMNSRTDPSYYSNLGGTTLESYLSNMVGDVGSDVENINTNAKNQNLVLNEVQNKLKSITGVNLDEELTDLIKYQRAYQAAARVFSVCSELMENMVNLGK